MAKFFGAIGISSTTETRPGIHTESYDDVNYKGDVLLDSRKRESSQHLNDDLVINNRISIVADAYAYANFSAMRYIEWEGLRWKITNIEIQPPRLILTIGGIFHVPTD